MQFSVDEASLKAGDKAALLDSVLSQQLKPAREGRNPSTWENNRYRSSKTSVVLKLVSH
ncbi:MAG: hypothetical protein IPN86_12415 [Saprospiraceae bacterium]|nr:hypothetical protein [Saprospiraceae bacterium]